MKTKKGKKVKYKKKYIVLHGFDQDMNYKTEKVEIEKGARITRVVITG